MFRSLELVTLQIGIWLCDLVIKIFKEGAKSGRTCACGSALQSQLSSYFPNLVRVRSLKTDGLLLGRFAAEDV